MSTHLQGRPLPPGGPVVLGTRIGRLSSRGSGAKRQRSPLQVRARLPGLLRACDVLIIVGAGAFAYMLRVATPDAVSAYVLEILLSTILAVNLLQSTGAYQFRMLRRTGAQLARATLCWAVAAATVVAIDHLGRSSEEYSAPWLLTWLPTAWAGLIVARLAARARILRMERLGRLTKTVAIAGSGAAAFELASRLKDADSKEAIVIGVFIDGQQTGAAGDIDDLVRLAGARHIDLILLALPWTSPAKLRTAFGKLAALPVDLGVESRISGLDAPARDLGEVAGVATLTIQRQPLLGWGGPLKRMEDVCLASCLIALFGPLMIAIWALIKLDSRGPVLFRQERFGFNNNRIVVFKFRTMRHEPAPDPSVPQARRGDPRVTRIGRFLRRTSLDELPQLFNVLRGDMSLVGPRPHATAHNERYARLIDGYLGRHRMKPGITGWAQINGYRGETETVEKMRLRLQHDLHYIDNWSLFLDIKILLKTVPVIFGAINAY